VADLAPQREALQHVVVLPLVAVRQARAGHAAADGQRRARLGAVGPEAGPQVADHAVHRVAVEQQVAVVVRDAVQAAQDRVLRAGRPARPPRRRAPAWGRSRVARSARLFKNSPLSTGTGAEAANPGRALLPTAAPGGGRAAPPQVRRTRREQGRAPPAARRCDSAWPARRARAPSGGCRAALRAAAARPPRSRPSPAPPAGLRRAPA